jgi:uroporphyrinogen-III decarboxylase
MTKVKNAYQLINTDIPVLTRRKETINPMNYTIKEIVYDPIKALDYQLYNIEQTRALDSDWEPFLEPWHGVGIYADAFGSETSWPEDDYPWTEPFINNISEINKLEPKKIENSPLMEKVLNTIFLFKEKTNGKIPISLTDTQSPLDTASLIVRTDELLVGLYTNPKIIHKLLNQITSLIITFSKMQLDIIGENVALPGHLFPYGAKKGIAISDDLAAMVSPEIYREFFVPYLSEISKEFGGLYLHSCGNFQHNLEAILEIDGLLGINMHIGEGDMDPLKAKKTIAGQCALWADVGLKWQKIEPTIEDFFRKYYLPGLLANGNTKGIMVEGPGEYTKLVDDVNKRRKLVEWTRNLIIEILNSY